MHHFGSTVNCDSRSSNWRFYSSRTGTEKSFLAVCIQRSRCRCPSLNRNNHFYSSESRQRDGLRLPTLPARPIDSRFRCDSPKRLIHWDDNFHRNRIGPVTCWPRPRIAATETRPKLHPKGQRPTPWTSLAQLDTHWFPLTIIHITGGTSTGL